MSALYHAQNSVSNIVCLCVRMTCWAAAPALCEHYEGPPGKQSSCHEAGGVRWLALPAPPPRAQARRIIHAQENRSARGVEDGLQPPGGAEAIGLNRDIATLRRIGTTGVSQVDRLDPGERDRLFVRIVSTPPDSRFL